MSASSLTLARIAALNTLPVTGQTVLAAHPDADIRRILAAQPCLAGPVRDKQLTDPDRVVRRYAAARLTDPARIAALLRTGGGAVHAGLAANPHTPVALLNSIALTTLTPHSTSARAALANPSTDPHVVLAALSAAPMTCAVGSGSEAVRAMAAARILAAQPQVGELWSHSKDPVILRAVARRPEITPEVAERIAALQGKRGMRSLAGNPFVPGSLVKGALARRRELLEEALAGRDPRAACADPNTQGALAAQGHGTIDLLIAQAGATDKTYRIWCERRTPSVEPDVLLTAITDNPDRTLTALRTFGSTRLSAITKELPLLSWRSPSALPATLTPSTADIEAALDELGDDVTAWKVFVRLIGDGTASPDEAVTAALGVAA